MLSIENLKMYGADVEDGLGRCMNNEGFYLKLVERSLQDASFDDLETAIHEGDLDKAFEVAHSLKGVMGNLALTPIYNPVVEITELLRSRTNMDYTELKDKIIEKRDELAELCK